MAENERRYVVLPPQEHAVLGEREFGMAGLIAVESVGPFTGIQATGPLITVHDSTIEAGLGIGHHPHRYNERLFFIEEGELDHDDARNHITGHMDTGDVGQFTEGRGGMIHSEWNHGDVDTHAYILVYSTDPIPEQTAFHVLKDGDAPRYDESAGVHTKELVGPRSPLRVHGDIRLFTDARMDAAASATIDLCSGEGGLASVREGALSLETGEQLERGSTLIVPPADASGAIRLRALQPSRMVRVVHGPGHGFVRAGRS